MPGPLDDPELLALLLAGGEGRRLRPLTARIPKPLVAFGGSHRIIDFALANLAAAGFHSVHVAGPPELMESLPDWSRCWRNRGGLLAALPAPSGRYRGTGDAVRSARALICAKAPGIVAVLPSDHVYGCVFPAFVEAHRSRGNAVTLAVARAPGVESAQLGVVSLDDSGHLSSYREKPDAAALEERASCLVSTGIFLFDTDVLLEFLDGHAAPEDADWDFAPHLFPRERVATFVFENYWRDVGTIGAYWNAHMDLLRSGTVFDEPGLAWPDPPGTARPALRREGTSLLGAGCAACPGGVRRSVVAEGVTFGDEVNVEDSVLMSGVRVGAGARIQRAIVEGPNALPDGFDTDRDSWPRDPRGVAVIPAGTFPAA